MPFTFRACVARRSALALLAAGALLLSAFPFPARAQAPTGVAGEWDGALSAGGATLHVRLRIAKAADGMYTGVFKSVDQGAEFPVDHIVVAGDSLHFGAAAVNGTFWGKLNAAGDAIAGFWSQGTPLALNLTRVKAAPAPAGATAPGTAAAPPQAPAVLPMGVPMDLAVPVPPTPFSGDGKMHLAYELHVTNLSPWPLLLKRVEVFGDGAPLLSIEGDSLNLALGRPGVQAPTDARSIGPGLRAVVYVWVRLDPGAKVPARLRHRVTVGEQSTEGAAIAVSTNKPLIISPPFRGAGWVAANGPANGSGHRRALIPVDGAAHIAQRFAIDWIQVGANGSTFTGDRLSNKSYNAYGTELLAVADGVVSATKDGIPENVPGASSRAVPITLETIGGNHVIVDLGSGHYAFYAHVQPGSLRVKVGDRVKKGQVLALLGNSGNSTEPHLHFHVSDGNSPLGSDGVPYLLDSFDMIGAAGTTTRHNELPMLNARVNFGAARPK